LGYIKGGQPKTLIKSIGDKGANKIKRAKGTKVKIIFQGLHV
jgi:hypothetical protein